MAWLRAPGNAVAFGVRSRVGWSRGEALLPHEEKGDLFAHLPGEVAERAEGIERELCARYDLDAFRSRSTRVVWRDGLVRLHAMERMLAGVELPVSGDGVLRAVDAGCGAFHYASVLQRFFAQFGGASQNEQQCAGALRAEPRRVVLRGLEVDGHGIYRDGHSRADHARAHAKLAGDDVHFQVADFAHANLPEQDVVTAWFPFVTRYALLRWGLPLSLFAPKRFFERAAKVVRKGGLLVVVNQTERESERVDALCASQPFTVLARTHLATDWADRAEATAGWTGSVFVRN